MTAVTVNQAQQPSAVDQCGTADGGARARVRAHRRQHGASCKACACSSLPAEFKRKTTFAADWWPAIAGTLFGAQKLSRFVALWAAGNDPVVVEGEPELPQGSPFVLAANHVSGVGHITSMVAAVLKGLGDAHGSIVDEVAVVAGTRLAPRPGGILQRGWRNIWTWAKARWSYNLIETQMLGEQASAQLMLKWRRKAARQPTLLFPEGVPRPLYGPVRPGSGNWLQSMKQPVLPVAVWWHGGAWHVRFGKAIRWSEKSELHDLQLGLAIADLMPRQMLSREWLSYLERRERLRMADEKGSAA